MAYRPCQTQTSPTYATTSGQNTPSKSPITSQSLPSPNFKPPLMAPFSIVRTSTPRLSVFTAHAYTTNPLSRLSKILRSSNNFRTNQSLLSLVESLQRQHGKAYPWAVGSGRQLPSGYILAKRKKDFRSGRPIISFVDSPFRPMLNILARLIFQLIPVACPNHFATGDVYTLDSCPF